MLPQACCDDDSRRLLRVHLDRYSNFGVSPSAEVERGNSNMQICTTPRMRCCRSASHVHHGRRRRDGVRALVSAPALVREAGAVARAGAPGRPAAGVVGRRAGWCPASGDARRAAHAPTRPRGTDDPRNPRAHRCRTWAERLERNACAPDAGTWEVTSMSVATTWTLPRRPVRSTQGWVTLVAHLVGRRHFEAVDVGVLHTVKVNVSPRLLS